jgi:hypothetical protein
MRALSVLLLLALAAPALAQTPPPETPEPPPEPPAVVPPALAAPTVAPPLEEDPAPERRKYQYRWQVLGPDLAAIGMSIIVDRISADGGDRPTALATLTIATYFFGAPLVHGIHRQGKRALISFGLRAGLPLVLGLLGEELDGTPPCDFCDDSLRSEGKLIGITIGVLAAMAVDGVLLARPIYRRVERPRTVWAPTLRGVTGGATAGVAGTF